MAMRYRAFGLTGLRVSELVVGGGQVGGLLVHQDDDTKLAALRRAVQAGINWIDTAPSYGAGRSEDALGRLLPDVDGTPYVSTKFRIDPERANDIAGQIEASLHESLTRLRRDSVELLQLHNPIRPESGAGALAEERVLGKGGVADVLERLREQGLFRFIGITALGDAACCRRVVESGRFDSAQVYYNLLNPSAGRKNVMPAGWSGQEFHGLLAACRAHGVATMNIRVLAAGVLASERRTGRENAITEHADLPEEERRARAVFKELGDGHGTRAQTALRFALGNPDLSCVIVGMAEPAHLEEALAAAEMGPLPGEALARLEGLYATDFGRLG